MRCNHGVDADDISILLNELDEIEYGKEPPKTVGTYCRSCMAEAILDGRAGIDYADCANAEKARALLRELGEIE